MRCVPSHARPGCLRKWLSRLPDPESDGATDRLVDVLERARYAGEWRVVAWPFGCGAMRIDHWDGPEIIRWVSERRRDAVRRGSRTVSPIRGSSMYDAWDVSGARWGFGAYVGPVVNNDAWLYNRVLEVLSRQNGGRVPRQELVDREVARLGFRVSRGLVQVATGHAHPDWPWHGLEDRPGPEVTDPWRYRLSEFMGLLTECDCRGIGWWAMNDFGRHVEPGPDVIPV